MSRPNFHPVNKEGLVYWTDYRLTGSVSALGTVKDYSGNGNNGTLNGDAYIDSNGMNFDGTGDHINLGTSKVIKPDYKSFSCWAKFDSISNEYNAIHTINHADYEYAVLIKSNGKMALYVFGENGQARSIDGTGTNTLIIGTWYHIACVYATDGIKIYINGEIDATNLFTAVPIRDTPGNSIIGNDLFYTPRGFDGIIDNVQIYNRALSAGEIKRNYERNKKS